ncbi:MAG: selenocysteine-specific translation elongation factor [Desulfobacterales bacterium]|nr:selenocysteine-specific translation elongation factor [Desulfobacterales bacterium]
MKQFILGTAGHIDHGKTALVKALTGVDTDRLKEEKARGITIELGFAALNLPGGRHLGIVDVPGHEKFVKNMVAGATGIDIVAMVIAADEGVRPQTREHLEICILLGIQHGVIVLTKTDLVDEEWLELAKEDIQDFVQGTFLEDAPMLPVSALTGSGIPELVSTLDDLCASIPERALSDIFRLPIDRVFTMKGFGTVITGTLISGKVQVGDSVMIYPSQTTSKVRGIQFHNDSVAQAYAGMRTAINFQGLEKSAVFRGQVVAGAGTLVPNYMIDVSFQYLASNKKPLKNRSRVRFHTGTSEVLGNLILLEADELMPGETTVVQIRLDTPLATIKDDRYVIRSYSPVRTIGGGRVLNPIPQKHKRFKADIVQRLKGILAGDPENNIAYYAEEAGYGGVSFANLRIMTNLPEKQLQQALQNLMSKKTLLQIDKENKIYIHNDTMEKLKQDSLAHLKNYHQVHPLKEGMSKEELKSKFPPILTPRFFNQVLNQMVKDNEIVQDENFIRLQTHAVSLGGDQTDIKNKILESYRQSGLTPPYFRDLSSTLPTDAPRAKDMLMLLINEGRIIKSKDDLYFHADTIAELKDRIIAFLQSNGEMTPTQFKDMTGLSRKYLIPLLEYFDSQNVTIRVGDVRRLRSR